jgi:hypothetical protein
MVKGIYLVTVASLMIMLGGCWNSSPKQASAAGTGTTTVSGAAVSDGAAVGVETPAPSSAVVGGGGSSGDDYSYRSGR